MGWQLRIPTASSREWAGDRHTGWAAQTALASVLKERHDSRPAESCRAGCLWAPRADTDGAAARIGDIFTPFVQQPQYKSDGRLKMRRPASDLMDDVLLTLDFGVNLDVTREHPAFDTLLAKQSPPAAVFCCAGRPAARTQGAMDWLRPTDVTMVQVLAQRVRCR